MRIEIIEDGECIDTCTVEELLEANEGNGEVYEAIEHLREGALETHLGGGAAPLVTLKRVEA